MSRACDEFAQEISSGPLNPSKGLRRHMAACKSCKEAYEAVCALKRSRKPSSKKEALAIAAILSVIKAGPAGSAADAAGVSETASSIAPAMAGAKGFVVICCSLLAVISAVFLYNGASLKRQQCNLSPSIPLNDVKAENSFSQAKPHNPKLNNTASDSSAISSFDSDIKHVPLKPGPQEAQIRLYAPNQEAFGK